MADPRLIGDADRLAAVRDTELLDAPSNAALDRLTRLTTRLLGVPTAVVTLVDGDREYFASSTGLRADLALARQSPLSHSFCQHVVATSAPLVVADSRLHPLVHDNPAISDYEIAAYAGMPLRSSSGQVLGSFCAFDNHPKAWSPEDLQTLEDLAQAAMSEIEYRAAGRLVEVQEEQLRELLDHTEEIVARLHPSGSLIYANAAMQQLLGVPVSDERSDWLLGRLTAESRAHFESAWGVALSGEPSAVIEISLSATDGRDLLAVVRLVPAIARGVVIGVRLFGQDVTELRRVEQTKDQMISIVSHELRTPIGAVQGALQLLGRFLPADLGARERGLLALAGRNADRLLGLVNDLLDLDRREAGSAPLDLADVTLAEILVPVADAMLPLAERARVRLEMDAGDARVRADASRLSRVLINLIGNAIKFTPADGRVGVDAVPDGANWRVRITDSGRGIPQDQLERIFERFAQVARADATEKGGTGLGLAIARAIVLQHGGRIWVESTPGEGSVFQFTVPRAHDSSPSSP